MKGSFFKRSLSPPRRGESGRENVTVRVDLEPAENGRPVLGRSVFGRACKREIVRCAQSNGRGSLGLSDGNGDRRPTECALTVHDEPRAGVVRQLVDVGREILIGH